MEPLLMMRPPCGRWRFIRPKAPWAHRKAPLRLTSTTVFHCAKVSSSIGTAGAPWPALLNKRSSRPNSRSMVANSAFTAAGSPTSAGEATARRPRALISPAASSSGSRRRPASATCQPARASAGAAALPIPEPAPVTRAKCSPSMVSPLSLKDPLLPQFRRHPPDGGAEHDRAAEHGRQARVLAEGKKHPYRSEHNIEQADEARFGGRDELGPLHEDDEGEPDRRQAEHEQDDEIVEPDRRRRRIGKAEDSGAERAEAIDHDHRSLRLAPLKHNHASEGERHQHRQRLSQEAPRTEAACDHDDDAEKRQARGGEGARADAFAIDDKADRR